jgi:quercetin dioxygenase-like cupin family protein
MASQSAAQSEASTDPVQTDPKHCKIEFENGEVRVLRISFGPNERSEMHTHPPMVAIFLTDHHICHRYSDGTTEEMRGKAGDVRYVEAWEHSPENLTDKPFECIVVEVKN